MKAIREYYKLKGKEVFFYIQTEYENKKLGKKAEYTKIDMNNEILDELDEKKKVSLNFFLTSKKDYGDKTEKIEDENYIYLSGYENNIRTDKDMIKVVEKLGSKEASGNCAELQIVEIPDDVKYYVDEYDGIESINEEHRSWG